MGWMHRLIKCFLSFCFHCLLGHYMYIETSKGSLGHSAILISLELNLKEPSCFFFYYHMFGRDVGKLHIQAHYGNNTVFTVWSKDGNQGNTWFLGKVAMETNIKKVAIVGIHGNGFSGDIAVDDFMVLPGSCPGN